MSEPTLEECFERFRSAGDLGAMAQVFDRAAGPLLAMAVHLVRDPVEAEDLVQSTFLAALEGARAFDAARRLEPWLAGILVRQAWKVRRQRARRPALERLRREDAPDPAELVEQRELAARLARALAELDEPYRSVLAQHLRGERALDIARREGHAPGMVRMQILRGLERLRRALPAGLFALVPVRVPRGLAAVRAEVLAQGGGAAAPTSIPWIGGLLVSSKLVLSVAAAAAIVALSLWRARSTSSPAGVAGAVTSPPPNALVEPRIPVAEPDTAPRRTRMAGGPVPRARSGLGEDSAGERVEQHGVFLVGDLLGLGELASERTRIDVSSPRGGLVSGTGARDHRYVLDVTALLDSPRGRPPSFYVEATHPAGRWVVLEFPLGDEVRPEANERTELSFDLDLAPRTAIVGRVATPAGVEPEAVNVGLVSAAAAEDATKGWETLDERHCDGEGVFALFPAEPGEYLVLARVRQLLPAARRVRAEEGRATDAGVLALENGGVSIEGTVRVPFEARLDGWHVRAERLGGAPGARGDWLGVALRGSEAVPVGGWGFLGADGRFTIAGLEPGAYVLQLGQEDGDEIVLPFQGLNVTAPAAGVVLGENYGRVRVSASLAEVGARAAELRLLLERNQRRRRLADGESVDVIADRGLPLSFELTAPGCERASARLAAGTRGPDERLELALAPDEDTASLVLDWSVPPGIVAPDAVTACWRRGRESGETSGTPVAGGCRFDGWQPGRYVVSLEPRGGEIWELTPGFLGAEPVEVELVAGGETRASVAWQVGGRARFVPAPGSGPARESLAAEVCDAAGRRLAVRFTQRSYSDGVLTTGSFRDALPLSEPSELLPNLAPGSYELVLRTERTEVLRLPFAIVAGETAEVPFVVP